MGDGVSDTGPYGGLYQKLERWIQRDIEARKEWREEASKAYDFVAGRQWSDEDLAWFAEHGRPAVEFNRTDVIIRSVSGAQIANPQQTVFKPRGLEDARGGEIITEIGRWFHDHNEGDDAEDEAFRDACICGLGFTETRLDFDEDPDGEPVVERIDPFEMGWDYNARRRNLSDARRMWRRRDMTLGEAKAMFPDVSPEKLNCTSLRDTLSDRSELERNAEEYGGQGVGDGEDASGMSDDDIVCLVHVEWTETKRFHTDPAGQEYDTKAEALEMARAGLNPDVAEAVSDDALGVAPGSRLVRMYAWLGSEILEEGEAPLQEGFRWQPITAFRDQNKNRWYGLTRSMEGPQRMANKLYSQALHLLNTSAKGGIVIERDAVEDQAEFEKSFAKNDVVSVVEEGGISKIMPKPTSQLPNHIVELLGYATDTIRDASGVSQEMMGMREANQPGILEDMRRQQGMMVLADLFKALRRYRRRQGKLMLELIQRYISVERMQRIVDQKYTPDEVQAAKEISADYDVVVDEAPMSINQKEQVWSMLSGIWSSFPPPVQQQLWKYAPFPDSVAQEVYEAYGAFMESQSPPPEEVELSRSERVAKVNLDNAKAQQAMSKTV